MQTGVKKERNRRGMVVGCTSLVHNIMHGLLRMQTGTIRG